jgi:hypothetical protein
VAAGRPQCVRDFAAVFGYPLITVFLDYAYACWFIVLQTIVLWQAFSTRDPRLRQQFFYTYLLAWIILGSAAALIFSSAGPCFYGRITGAPDPFVPLMDYLREVDRIHRLAALKAQAYLWQTYQDGNLQVGSGISAMPSMHLSMATLFALLGWRVDRRLGVALTVYLVLLFIGSIELGWYYALDGYVAIAATVIIWAAVGRLPLFRPQQQPQPA